MPVRLPAQATTTDHIAGWLCADGSPRVVEVPIPGLTYGASYWKFPLDPSRYSYVRAATAAGFATLGHSYGSDVALREAATYADVSGVISTRWLTAGNLAGHLQVRDSYDASARDDPKFAHVSLPDGYVTTKPGRRPGREPGLQCCAARRLVCQRCRPDHQGTGQLRTAGLPAGFRPAGRRAQHQPAPRRAALFRRR